MAFPSPEERFADFTAVKGIPYASIRDQPLRLDILIPKTLTAGSRPASFAGPRPVMVNFHGGGLILGARDFVLAFPKYMLSWAASHGALVVAPDYPLTPESQSPEMAGALRLLMDWLLAPGNLLRALQDGGAPDPPLAPDLDRVLVHGESGGGWPAMHVGQMYAGRVRALILRYPILDLEDAEHFGNPDMKSVFFTSPPPEGCYEAHMAKTPKGTIARADVSQERIELGGAIYMTGQLVAALGDGFDETYPLRALERGGARLPERVWLFHGTEDDLVPCKGSLKAAKLIEDKCPGSEVRCDTRTAPHAFDTEWDLNGEDTLPKERLAWLAEAWLR